MDWWDLAMLFRAARRIAAIAFLLGMLFARDQTAAIFTSVAKQQIEERAAWVDRVVTPAIVSAFEGAGGQQSPSSGPSHRTTP